MYPPRIFAAGGKVGSMRSIARAISTQYGQPWQSLPWLFGFGVKETTPLTSWLCSSDSAIGSLCYARAASRVQYEISPARRCTRNLCSGPSLYQEEFQVSGAATGHTCQG